MATSGDKSFWLPESKFDECLTNSISQKTISTDVWIVGAANELGGPSDPNDLGWLKNVLSMAALTATCIEDPGLRCC